MPILNFPSTKTQHPTYCGL